jgi:RNA polymerase sigma-70 factor, ECF subfamily
MEHEPTKAFVAEITAVQRRLHGFVRTLVYDRDAIDEIVQETNVALWEQAERFEPGTNFAAWACKVAWFKVLDHRRDRKLTRIRFADELVETLAAESIRVDEESASERAALERCVAKLSTRHRDLLALYYEKRLPLPEIAATLDSNANALGQMLHRIRASLRECVRRQLGSPAS